MPHGQGTQVFSRGEKSVVNMFGIHYGSERLGLLLFAC